MAQLLSRPEAFHRALRNAGVVETEARELAAAAREYESSRGRPPSTPEDVRVFAREKAVGSLQREREIGAALGAYLVFVAPGTSLDVGAMVRAVIGFEPENVVKAAAKAFEGEGKLGRLLNRTIGWFARENVRRWLAPVATAAVIALALLENPIYRMFNPGEPAPAQRIPGEQEQMDDPAMQRAYQLANLASSLARALDSRWKTTAAPADATLETLVQMLPTSSREKYNPLLAAYELDAMSWAAAHHRSGGAPQEYVLLRREKPGSLVVVTPEASTFVSDEAVCLGGGTK